MQEKCKTLAFELHLDCIQIAFGYENTAECKGKAAFRLHFTPLLFVVDTA